MPAWLFGGTRQRRIQFCASGWEATKEGPLFSGARLTIEPGSDFPIGVNNLGFRVAAAQPSRWIPRRTGPAVHLSRSAPHRRANDDSVCPVLVAFAKARGSPPGATQRK